MVMVSVDNNSLQADSQPKSVVFVYKLALLYNDLVNRLNSHSN